MDPTIGWYQPEQLGPAEELWTKIWETQLGFESMEINNKAPDYIPMCNANVEQIPTAYMFQNGGKTVVNNYYNRVKRKRAENVASGNGSNENELNFGTPWRKPGKHYSHNVIG